MAWLQEHAIELLGIIGIVVAAWYGLKSKADDATADVAELKELLEAHLEEAKEMVQRFIVMEEQVKVSGRTRKAMADEILRLRERQHDFANKLTVLMNQRGRR